MSLFADPLPPYPTTISSKDSPLAHRMCPLTIDEFVGQRHILGEGGVLRRAIDKDVISSIILFGPSGTGKTALARIIANCTRSDFKGLNAATVGIDELKKTLNLARKDRSAGRKTLLFIDEIHRFNKLQQDALLPDVEQGNIKLIAATVENPFFYVNKALISRSQVYEFKPLSEDDILLILKRALADRDRGLGAKNIEITDDAVQYMVLNAEGDARRALNTLEFIVAINEEEGANKIYVDLTRVKEVIQKKSIRYDKDGDDHYNNISAFIKSMRGSDPDATVYYLAKMLYAGEDPRFISRRILICASEDVGNADPMALVVATSAFKAVEVIGMPEARIILAQAAIYVALAKKCNASYQAIENALKDVQEERTLDVPDHLKDNHYREAKGLGYGEGYKYPHDFGGYVQQEYLVSKKRYYLRDPEGH